MFVDAFNHNFAVKDLSPAIDAGIYVGLTSDLIGESVPFGNNPDIGVIEINEIVTSIVSKDNTKYVINVYPNPTNGQFSFSLNDGQLLTRQGELNIQDTQGNTLLVKQYADNSGEYNKMLDISNFPAGIYILSLKIANTIYSQRIVKIF